MNKQTIETAARRLLLDSKYSFEAKFSRKFRPYNCNVKKTGNILCFNFSHEWKSVSDEISIGLVQELLIRILKIKVRVKTNIELYDNFVKNLHLSAQSYEHDSRLRRIFEMVNEKYFNNSIDMPSLKWGLQSKTKLATYSYHTDTINVSSVFRQAEDELVAYLIYHEMLHKKLKFKTGKRHIHHSKEFKLLEKTFENQQELEKKLKHHLRQNRNFLETFINMVR